VVENDGPRGTWGTCRFCGVAVAPGSTHCGICGAEKPIAAGETSTAPRNVRRWVRLTHAFRTFVVVVVVAGLAYAILSAELAGPPVLTGDPLTTAGTYTLGPGNFTVISGDITAGDYVTGNFTAVHPVGVNIGLAVYNSTQWNQFMSGQAPTPLYTVAPSANAAFVYPPIVTDTYYFVFSNPYTASSHLTVGVYITTLYNPNVANDGFA
jgi:hypothetical protein